MEIKTTTTPNLKDLDLAGSYARARAKHLMPAMERSVTIVRSAVRSAVPVGATGAAANSIVSKVYQLPSRVTGKVRSTFTRPLIYIYVLNYGRLPGKKAPPTKALVPWVISKGLASTPKDADRIAYLIARKIKERGNRRPVPFTRAAAAQCEGQVSAIHQRAVEAIVQELSLTR